MVELGNKLKKLRTDARYTQKEIATQFGLAGSAISSYETGERCPPYDVLIKYARKFHVTTDYLLGINEIEYINVSELNDEKKAIIMNFIELIRKL